VKGSCSDVTSDSGLKLSTNFPSYIYLNIYIYIQIFTCVYILNTNI